MWIVRNNDPLKTRCSTSYLVILLCFLDQVHKKESLRNVYQHQRAVHV